MSVNNIALNRLFTQSVFNELLRDNNSSFFASLAKKYVDHPESKSNADIISEIYRFMSKEYRNEYYYQNTLINKLLFGVHSLNTTTALTQIPIEKSKADFILINGKAVVYEIKTGLDNFERLSTQIRDYYKAFDQVCVVTSECQYETAYKLLKNTCVGIRVLTSKNTISSSLNKEIKPNMSCLEHKTIFKVLHKNEQEVILLKYYGELPKTTQVFYYDECMKWFSEIPIVEAYSLALEQLKGRNQIATYYFEKIPYELKSLVYFLNPRQTDWQDIYNFLQQKYGG